MINRSFADLRAAVVTSFPSGYKGNIAHPGGPHAFVVDTGATFTCIHEPLADSLDPPERTGGVGFGAGIGGSGRVRLVRLDSIRVGATSAFDLTACAIPLGELQQAGLDADGLLGLNFPKSFRVTFDFETNTMHFDRPRRAPGE